ncbi:MAG: MotA/TolQ/ExbB proton channel family protein [Bryobacteraceae bacterium]|nr:MotA/TolQ/ExbB proton channel family protein [Bryobacteraceae bacterium]
MTFPVALILQVSILELVLKANPVSKAILVVLLLFSVFSWAIIFAKWNAFRQARAANGQFLRAFRKANGMEAVALASEQFRASPLVSVFEFGYTEMDRQAKSRGGMVNTNAVERSLQLGISEEITKLERNMNWLATAATVSPFVGLLGTVWGIIGAFQALGLAGSASLRAVAPGIADALVATAVGLAAAIPAAVFYNHFGHVIREFGSRMDDFSLEFMNWAERTQEQVSGHLR